LLDRDARAMSTAETRDQIPRQAANRKTCGLRARCGFLRATRYTDIGGCISWGRRITLRRHVGLRRRSRLKLALKRRSRFEPFAERGKFLLHGIGQEITVARQVVVVLEVPIGRPSLLAPLTVNRAFVI